MAAGMRKFLGEPVVIALEIIDQVITEKFGFHVFEGQVSLKEMPITQEKMTEKETDSGLVKYKQESLLKM